jgi:hypothetical protein
MADKKTIKDLLADEIKDLYSAERQLTKAIPKMAKGSSDAVLKEAFTSHLQETQGQVKRLEEIAGLLEIKPAGKKCVGMEGVIQEGAEALTRQLVHVSPRIELTRMDQFEAAHAKLDAAQGRYPDNPDPGPAGERALPCHTSSGRPSPQPLHRICPAPPSAVNT